MSHNVGSVDRAIRIIAGLILIGLAVLEKSACGAISASCHWPPA